jgi:putative protease
MRLLRVALCQGEYISTRRKLHTPYRRSRDLTPYFFCLHFSGILLQFLRFHSLSASWRRLIMTKKAKVKKGKKPAKKVATKKAPKKKKIAKKKITKKKAVAKKKPLKKKAAKKKTTKKKTAKKSKSAPKKAAAAKSKTAKATAVPGAPPVKEEAIGSITHYYSHLQVALVQLNKGTLTTGDVIHIKGHTTDFTQTVESMEYEHQQINLATAGQSFGLRVKDHVREHDIVYRVK